MRESFQLTVRWSVVDKAKTSLSVNISVTFELLRLTLKGPLAQLVRARL
jgi:hypothetical protein